MSSSLYTPVWKQLLETCSSLSRRPALSASAVPLNALTAAITFFVLFVFNGPPIYGQENAVIDITREYNVKGAFLYSFGRYTSWPKETFRTEDDPFVIGYLGDAPVAPILSRIRQTKRIGGRRITIRHLTPDEPTNSCHILFVSRFVSESDQRALIRAHLKSAVLLVGETDDFTKAGGVIQFFVSGGSVRFEINVSAARRKRLSFDAKLLRLARVVQLDEEHTSSDPGKP